jgi:hypothetical protein
VIKIKYFEDLLRSFLIRAAGATLEGTARLGIAAHKSDAAVRVLTLFERCDSRDCSLDQREDD